MKQDIYISLNGSGSSSFNIKLHYVFVNYLLDLAEAISDSDFDVNMDIFETDKIKEQIEQHQFISVKEIESQDQNLLILKISYKNIEKIFTSENIDTESHKILTFNEKDGIKTIHFFLDKSNYILISNLFPLLKNSVFENLAPQVDEHILAAEYLDIIDFAMGEEGPDAVMSSFIEVKVKVEGEIISQTGGEIFDGFIHYKIPLLNILLLNHPIEYKIIYK